VLTDLNHVLSLFFHQKRIILLIFSIIVFHLSQVVLK